MIYNKCEALRTQLVIGSEVEKKYGR